MLESSFGDCRHVRSKSCREPNILCKLLGSKLPSCLDLIAWSIDVFVCGTEASTDVGIQETHPDGIKADQPPVHGIPIKGWRWEMMSRRGS